MNTNFKQKALIPKAPSDAEYRVVVVKHEGKYYLKTLDDQRVFEMPATGRLDDLAYPTNKELVLINYDPNDFGEHNEVVNKKCDTENEFIQHFTENKSIYLYLYFNIVNKYLRDENKTQITTIPTYLFIPYYDHTNSNSKNIVLYNSLTNKFDNKSIPVLEGGMPTRDICLKYKINEISKQIKLYKFDSIVQYMMPPAYFYYKEKLGDTERKEKQYIHELIDLKILDKCQESAQGGGSSRKKSRKLQKRNQKHSKTRCVK